jgi:hypothetical protein
VKLLVDPRRPEMSRPSESIKQQANNTASARKPAACIRLMLFADVRKSAMYAVRKNGFRSGMTLLVSHPSDFHGHGMF